MVVVAPCVMPFNKNDLFCLLLNSTLFAITYTSTMIGANDEEALAILQVPQPAPPPTP